MNNVLEYLNWRGDISFKERKFNEVDSLICALLGYVEWDNIVSNEAVYLNEACKKYYELHSLEEMNLTYSYSPMIADLIKKLQNVPRYNEVKLKKYASIFDTKVDAQFAAVSIEIPNDILYISFRGTDSSILGWKEDFNMTFQDVISSQEMAVKYLQHAYLDIVKEKKILGIKYIKKTSSLYLGGHSKGGNLAMYAAICCKEMQPFITSVDSFDGPGFREQFYDNPQYLAIIERIHNYVPIGSIIGRMMEHKEKFTILNAYSSGLQQHDGFYWQVERDRFNQVETWSEDSNKVKVYLEEVLLHKSDEEKKNFISLVYKVLEDLKINSINDFTEISFKNGIQGIKELTMMSKEEYKMFYEILKLGVSQSKSFLYQKAMGAKVKHEKNH